MEFKLIINTGATTSYDPPRRIIHEALLYINKNDGTAVPNYPSTQRTMERKRKQQDKSLPTPTSFNDIFIPDELRVTNVSKRFLLYDNRHSDHKIIVLSSDEDLDRLSNSEHWQCHGTFKVPLMITINFYSNLPCIIFLRYHS